jgi:hypothetical protein
VYLRAQATGTFPLACQWREDGVELPGATNWWVHIDHVAGKQAARYEVVVSNEAGSVTNLIATLTGPAPFALAQPTVADGQFHCIISPGGAAGQCVLWVSPDLAAWTPVQTNALGTADFEFTAPVIPGQPARFYRATVAP